MVLTAIAAVEFSTGLGLLFAPSLVAQVLLGLPIDAGAPLVVARVAGLALISIGLTCAVETVRAGASPPTGLLVGLLAYNGAVPFLLVHSYMTNQAGGIGLWPTVVLHLAFTLWIAACLRPNAASGTVSALRPGTRDKQVGHGRSSGA